MQSLGRRAPCAACVPCRQAASPDPPRGTADHSCCFSSTMGPCAAWANHEAAALSRGRDASNCKYALVAASACPCHMSRHKRHVGRASSVPPRAMETEKGTSWRPIAWRLPKRRLGSSPCSSGCVCSEESVRRRFPGGGQREHRFTRARRASLSARAPWPRRCGSRAHLLFSPRVRSSKGVGQPRRHPCSTVRSPDGDRP